MAIKEPSFHTYALDLIGRLQRKYDIAREQLEQYRNDLVFWKTAHNEDYAGRRITELDQKIKEIDSI